MVRQQKEEFSFFFGYYIVQVTHIEHHRNLAMKGYFWKFEQLKNNGNKES